MSNERYTTSQIVATVFNKQFLEISERKKIDRGYPTMTVSIHFQY